MLKEALELGILNERTEAIWRKSLLEMAYHEAVRKVQFPKRLQRELGERDSDLEASGEEYEDDKNSFSNTILPALRTNSIQVSQYTKTGSGISSLKEEEKEERLPIQQSKHDDGHDSHEEKKEKERLLIEQSKYDDGYEDTDKDKGTDNGEGETLTLTPKLSKLSLKGSYRKLKEVSGKFKRSRVGSLFQNLRDEGWVGEQEY
ncbi:hypothetical protein B0T26DRAFT_671661 [Lasiosphaeria miniovina]|uniref:Uncharacterized protein n=1 Tax=Lasiosphaeria miniovina TaxID=1954250 RepID=A0AA40B3D5_9PEZI|nr:uncharacterized protein B0T26DRAFT_671661 [Lasiosphaeria miniovina]KAK0726924.1 hypothetical protein B0T26DRAFT_671661 [Lasiosphaeria miniovina]